MNDKKNNRVLLSPLDWGLGHTTRCIPIIGYLQQCGFEVVIAAEGASAQLLATEFPGIEIKKLKGYHIRYGSGSSLFATILRQIPVMLHTTGAEHKWLNKLLQKEEFQFIISDNRPGFYHPNVYSVYITHQLLIKSGKGNRLDKWLQKLHARYMKRFDEVWVPDVQGQQNLAGELSHPAKNIVQANYIGLLSRFEWLEESKPTYDLLILLSGPEPQRTILEQKIVHQLHNYTGSVLLVRGLPAGEKILPLKENVTVANHLPAQELQQAIASSKQMICRSGYTTLMDLIKMKKKALLIPTPGQPEQEYLAAYMQQQQYFPYVSQTDFHLQSALEQLEKFSASFSFAKADFELFKIVIDRVIKTSGIN